MNVDYTKVGSDMQKHETDCVHKLWVMVTQREVCLLGVRGGGKLRGPYQEGARNRSRSFAGKLELGCLSVVGIPSNGWWALGSDWFHLAVVGLDGSAQHAYSDTLCFVRHVIFLCSSGDFCFVDVVRRGGMVLPAVGPALAKFLSAVGKDSSLYLTWMSSFWDGVTGNDSIVMGVVVVWGMVVRDSLLQCPNTCERVSHVDFVISCCSTSWSWNWCGSPSCCCCFLMMSLLMPRG